MRVEIATPDLEFMFCYFTRCTFVLADVMQILRGSHALGWGYFMVKMSKIYLLDVYGLLKR